MNKSNNVNLWFARNNKGDIVTIDKSDKNEEYTCPMCSSAVIPKAKNSNKISPHFSHLDKSKCDSESMIHFWIKNELIKIGDIINFNNGQCYAVKNINIEKEIFTKHGLYIPDIMIETNDNQIVYIEIKHTNKKDINKYLPMWRELGNTVAEIDTKDILNNLFNKDNYEYKVIYDFENDAKSYAKAKKRFKLNVESNNINKDLLLDIDWFLKEIESYDRYEFDNTYIAINEAIKLYKQDAIELLNNSNCSKIKSDYIDYKIKRLNSDIQNIIECEVKCGNDFIIIKTNDYVLTSSYIWDDEHDVIEKVKQLIFIKEKELVELKIKKEERENVLRISDSMYNDLYRRYSTIDVVCDYDKTEKHNYDSKIVFPYNDIYMFFKKDNIDICKSYEYTTRKYIYNPKRHMSTPRWVKSTGFINIKSFNINCSQEEVNDFICFLFRKNKYNIEEV